MSRSQETQEQSLLFLLILIAIGLIIGGFWWASENSIDRVTSGSYLKTKKSTNRLPHRAYNFAQVQNVPSGIFNYGGSTTWAPIRNVVDPVVQSTWVQYRLRYTHPVLGNPGSGTGIRMLLDGQLSFAQSSRPLKEKEYAQAQQRGYSLKQIPVAIDGIAIGVNPNLQVAGLTIGQIKGIYTGEIINWQELGGADIPIIPYSRQEKEGGTVSFFADNVLGDEDFSKNVVLVKNTTEGIREVSSNPGGIYYATTAEIISQCQIKALPIGHKKDELISPYQKPFVPLSKCPRQRNQVNKKGLQSGKYPITRRLFVIVKQNGQIDEISGNAYANFMLSDQGQDLIDKAGFIRIH